MALRGNQAVKTINEGISRLEQELMAAQNEHRDCSRRVDSLMRDIDRCVSEAVKIISTSELNGGGKAGQKIHGLMEQRDARRREAKAKLADLRGEFSKAQAVLEVLQGEYTQATEAYEDARQSSEEHLQNQPQWQECLLKIQALEEQIEFVRQRAGLAMDDLRNKAPQYLNNPLFSYLLDRNHGRENAVKADKISSWVDSWVADLINYRDQEINYRKLHRLPEVLNSEQERLSGQRDELISWYTSAVENAWREWPNAPELEKNLANAKAKFDRQRHAVERIDNLVNDIDEELSDFSQGRDPFSTQIHPLLTGWLKEGGSAARLLVKATNSTDDDRLFELIVQTRSELERVQKEAERAWNKVSMIHDKLSKAKEFLGRFKRNLGSSSRTFTHTSTADLLTAVIAAKALDNLYDSMRRHSRVETSSYPSPPGSSSRSSSSSGSWGGGLGGGGFRSGGSMGGGGFRTGGGF